jgi:GAF domain
LIKNPWLAIDTATVPVVRARELRQAWEEFLEAGQLSEVRDPIARSWERSSAAGVDPSAARVAPVVTVAEETVERWASHPLSVAADLIRSCLSPIADADGNLIVVSDADGVLLWVRGPESVRYDAANSMNFTEGAGWGESDAGTNAVGTALAANHAVQVFAAEHFNEVVQQWTCSAAPVHDPDTGQLLGVIDLTGRMVTAHPHSLACAVATAQAVESHLRLLMQERDAHLRACYEDRVVGRRQALVTPTGRVIAGDYSWAGAERIALPPGGGELALPSGLTAFAESVGHEDAFVVRATDGGPRRRRPLLDLSLLGRDVADVALDGRSLHLGRRHTEIVALLVAHPDGMTTEELAADLYGDSGQPGSIRVQMHRLRRLFGGSIDQEPYRLAMDVRADLTRIQSLLDRGAVREAAERYKGPLLPHSEAPGVVREREALDAWLRQAVITSNDVPTLWAWVQSPSGADDLLAWKRLLAGLGYGDPRRHLAATHVASLRAMYAEQPGASAARRAVTERNPRIPANTSSETRSPV